MIRHQRCLIPRSNVQVAQIYRWIILSTAHVYLIQGYLSDPEIEFGSSALRPPPTPSHVKVWKWGQLPVEESISSTSNKSEHSYKSATSREFEVRTSNSDPVISSVPEPSSGPSENIEQPSGYDADSMIDSTDDEEEDDEDSNTETEPFFGCGVQISLCGGPGVPEDKITAEQFDRYRVSWETYSKDPRSIIENPRLVIRENDRYMNFLTVASILVARIFFESDLDQETIQKLKTPARRPWFFGFGKSKQSSRSSIANNNENNSLDDSLNEENSTSPTKPNTFDRFKGKTLTLEHEDLVKLNLKPGRNKVEFIVSSSLCHIYTTLILGLLKNARPWVCGSEHLLMAPYWQNYW